MTRVYLDWNARAPLRAEARAAMLAAMDAVGNPSSVHAEGRAARGIVERARGEVAALVGAAPEAVVFTSGATEACRMVLTAPRWSSVVASRQEHDAVVRPLEGQARGRLLTAVRLDRTEWLVSDKTALAVPDRFAAQGVSAERGEEECGAADHGAADHGAAGPPTSEEPVSPSVLLDPNALLVLPTASGETGILGAAAPGEAACRVFRDGTQAVARLPWDHPVVAGWDLLALSGHKMGAAPGVGALCLAPGLEFPEPVPGGGQEMGRRSGTEAVIAIAGFGAAAEAARRDLDDRVWERVAALRNILEEGLAAASAETIFVGNGGARLPNTSAFLTPGWAGETQVMQMDLAGYAVSAGAACSSGKVAESRALRAMGFGAEAARSALRVSLGPTTTEAEVRGFVRIWGEHYRRWQDRRAA